MTDFILEGPVLERLRAEAKAFGKQTELADKAGISPTTLSQILSKGGDVTVSRLGKITQALGRSLDYFFSDVGSESVESDSRALATDDLMPISEVDLAYGMGATFVDGVPVAEKVRYFPTQWVRHYTHAPAHKLFFARGRGNSMAPSIDSGDIMLIDTTEQRVDMADLIWAFTYGEMGMIKRLRGRTDGGISIMSDNPLVPPETAYDGEINILGRVVAVLKAV